MFRKARLFGTRFIPIQILVVTLVIVTLTFLSGKSGESISSGTGSDTDLFYEVWVGGEKLFETNELRDYFVAESNVESIMSEKLGYAYSLTEDHSIELVAIRKSSTASSADEMYNMLMSKTTALYSDCYALYVGDSIVGYCPISEKSDLEQLAVKIVGYISENDEAHSETSQVFAAIDYTYKTNIVNDISTISDALTGSENIDQTVSDVIESIDQAIIFGNISVVPETVIPELTVTSIRRTEIEYIPYEKFRCADIDYGLRYGDDDEDFIYIAGVDGEYSIEYEDVYVGDEYSHTTRFEDTKIIISEPIDEITIYGTQSTTPSGKLIWPTTGTITSGYGNRLLNGKQDMHHGIDIANNKGTPIVAADAGKVIFAGWSTWGWGYCVQIDHGNGFITLYAHMNKAPSVQVGELVFQGEVIGYMGASGNAYGYHLCFETWVNGARLNPRRYLP